MRVNTISSNTTVEQKTAQLNLPENLVLSCTDRR